MALMSPYFRSVLTCSLYPKYAFFSFFVHVPAPPRLGSATSRFLHRRMARVSRYERGVLGSPPPLLDLEPVPFRLPLQLAPYPLALPVPYQPLPEEPYRRVVRDHSGEAEEVLEDYVPGYLTLQLRVREAVPQRHQSGLRGAGWLRRETEKSMCGSSINHRCLVIYVRYQYY